MVCNQIVYKNEYGNCITNDTGILTISSSQPDKNRAVDVTNREASTIFEIECNYGEAINEELDKFDQHLCAYTASIIESKLIENMLKANKKECSHCIGVFYENETVDNEFIEMKRSTNTDLKIPCLSTVHIIIFANKIFQMLENKTIQTSTKEAYDRILKTIMNWLPIEELYRLSEFNLHEHLNETSNQLTHKEKIIHKVVSEYMKLKSKKIGCRISEEERGKYIRHNNKKRVHEKGQ